MDEMYKLYKKTYLQEYCVYIIFNKNTNFYKIGITRDFTRRFRQLELSSGCKLSIVDYYRPDIDNTLTSPQIEKKLHKKYKKHKIIGEWFDIHYIIDDVLNYYLNLCEN
tara:strand:+ start:125 stop:451 length:327 start_codon:yes stop_codon:yes gene_type:complete